MGHPDFRVGGKIFCTLAYEKEGFGVLMLTPEEQAGLVEDASEVFSPVPGGWGRGERPVFGWMLSAQMCLKGRWNGLEAAFGAAKARQALAP